MLNKKFIEEEFPITELSVIGSNEKSSVHSSITGLHVWWARRPTTIVRALILSSLIDWHENNKKERKKIRQFILNICADYKRIPNQLNITNKLKDYTANTSNGGKIKLLDSFSGGSAIPMEAARLGLESYGIDLNPVAVLIGKATSEYFQKYNGSLVEEVKKWWKILYKNLKIKMQKYYFNPLNKNQILSYIWVRQIKCMNPKCNALIPMLQTLILSDKKNRKIVIKPIVIQKKDMKHISFEIKKNDEIDFDFRQKIFSRGKVTCPACGITISNQETMEFVSKKKMADRLLLIVEKDKDNNIKKYRLATNEDLEIISQVQKNLEGLKHLIPKEKIPDQIRRWQVQNYGILEWKGFFNQRQMLFNIIYTEEVKKIIPEIKSKYDDKLFIQAIILHLSFILSRILTNNSKFCHWRVKVESIAQTWSRSGVFMKGNYPELNPFSDFSGTPNRYINAIEKISDNNLNFSNFAIIKQGNAMKLDDFEDGSIDLIITDPPYYDAMLYANPADFFYIWLKRMLDEVFPELFLLSLSPKDEEIIQSRFRHEGNKDKAREFYEDSLKKVLNEYNRILKPNGIGVIMYTHKSVDAWEVLINVLITSNFTISAAWPIKTEVKGGIRMINRVALASSIALVFKKVTKKKEIFFETQFEQILKEELDKKLHNLLVDLEIFGADFFISAIGYSLSIFTRYEKVLSQKTGDEISTSIFLDLVRKIVNDFLLSTVLERSVTQSIDEITNLYIIWCWFFRNNGIDLDDALKLVQSFGVGELDFLRKNKLIKLDSKKFKLLLASDKVRENHLIKNKDSLTTLIDNLHLLAILWKNNDKNLDEEVKKVEIEYSENIWKVGQALAEFFPNNHNEHNCLQGLLAKYGKAKSKSDLKKWI